MQDLAITIIYFFFDLCMSPVRVRVKSVAENHLARQVLPHEMMNALEAGAHKMLLTLSEPCANSQVCLYVGNDGQPVPAENRQSLFIPFFTTKRSGSGIGLSLSRRMMVQQGGMLELTEKRIQGCHTAFTVTLLKINNCLKSAKERKT